VRQPPEDYELWSRIARRFRVANLPERLTVYREVPGSVSRAGAQPFLRSLVLISSENLAWASGTAMPEQVHVDIAALTHNAPDLISAKPDLGRMCAVVGQAGRMIGEGARPPGLGFVTSCGCVTPAIIGCGTPVGASEMACGG
jgi:hypothetical protein